MVARSGPRRMVEKVVTETEVLYKSPLGRRLLCPLASCNRVETRSGDGGHHLAEPSADRKSIAHRASGNEVALAPPTMQAPVQQA